MRKNFFRNQTLSLFLGLGVCMIPIDSQAAPLQSSTTDDCSKEILLSYFPTPYVKDVLKKNNIPQDKWESIITALNEKDKTIISSVEEKAAKLGQNAMKDPKQRPAVVKLFRETLLEAFSQTLKANGVTGKDFQAMLDDIQQQKSQAFARCMEKHKNDAPATRSQTNSQ